ncbi:uncharacterized protein LOC132054245 [Lycium ferocissimum]|uniref:uncharacterized protein LOC132054245 n=1 Tax=Lycium ferocissimum TaxID=112874 RepID=UPI00281501D1|nr:uncharacterized protein LOC132054245 [Lycium ferocissimum]
MVAPWLIGVDFNVILNEEEKIGGLPVLPNEYEDFAFCLNSCELIKAGFKGSPFAWWNERFDGQCIFKRLDRKLVNNLLLQWFDFIEVDHLSRTVYYQRRKIQVLLLSQLWKVKQAVFELSGDSASSPDRLTVKVLFEGQTLPKSITHTNLVLLPKKNEVERFSDMRPIRLSNFINKVISRVVHYKLEKVLPRLISVNQSRFVKGGNIIENVLLTQEIISDITLRAKPANAHGFFHSTRGFKQGDPLSPSIFIQSAEVLTGALNALFDGQDFKGYGMPKWRANLNHLAYTDDTIVFSSADKKSLGLIMSTLKASEDRSSQLINKRKSSFYMHAKVSNVLVQQAEQITGFTRGNFPFIYLGCPITHARKKKADYANLIKKIRDKLQA